MAARGRVVGQDIHQGGPGIIPIELALRGIIVGISLGAPVGPINVEIVRRGLRSGFRSGWLVGIGATSADALYCIAVIAGLTPLIDQLIIRSILWTLGTGFLLFLAYMSIKTAFFQGRMLSPELGTIESNSFVTGFLMALLNPMGIFFWLSVGGGLVASGVDQASDILGIAAIVLGVIAGLLIWITTLSTLVHGGRRFISDRTYRWINLGSGTLLLGFGLWFGFQAIEGIAELIG
jgi:L-lysine exporter family protein LysE/ArgO